MDHVSTLYTVHEGRVCYDKFFVHCKVLLRDLEDQMECQSTAIKRKGRCHTDSNYPKYSRDQNETTAQNSTKHSRRYHGKDC